MGWDSNTYKYTKSSGTYEVTSGSWFMHSWWTLCELVKVYTNDTDKKVKVSSLTFKGCPGNSGWQPFSFSSGTNVGGDALPCYGYGCDFYAKLYVKDASGKEIDKIDTPIKIGHMNPVKDTNVMSHGVIGQTCKVSDHGSPSTDHPPGWHNSFGNPAYFSPPLCEQLHTLDVAKYFEDHPEEHNIVVPPGCSVYVHVSIDTSKWYYYNTDGSQTYKNSLNYNTESALFVMRWGGGNFTGVVDPVDESYIWVMTENGWQKSKTAYMMTQDKVWQQLKE